MTSFLQRILIIEDSVSFATALAAMLNHDPPIPTETVVTHNLRAGVARLERDDITSIIADLSLGDSDGLDTVSALKQAAPDLPLIVLTGSEQNLGQEAIKLGAQDYLLKGEITAKQLHRSLVYAMERVRSQRAEQERLRLCREREDFMATLTHDLKNPLLAGNRILEMIADEKMGPLNEEQRDLLQKVVDSNRGLLHMIRNLVEVYRYEKDVDSIVKDNTDLRRLLTSYLDEIQAAVEHKGIKLVTEVPPKMDEVCADPTSILRVFQNLLENAVKFTPSGGLITVRLWQDHDKALFEVTDTGPGITEEDRKKLFQRFRQGRQGQRMSIGTGLGLYLCRQIVQAHKGEICCKVNKGKGTTFVVQIPVSA
jgi:two-component system sensor histidine kinase/response regulator